MKRIKKSKHYCSDFFLLSVIKTPNDSIFFISVKSVFNSLISLSEKSLKYTFKHTETLNICTGKPVSINEVISTLEKVTGITPKMEYNKTNEQVNYLIGDPSKAKKVLDYKAEVGLEEGLTKMIEEMGER